MPAPVDERPVAGIEAKHARSWARLRLLGFLPVLVLGALVLTIYLAVTSSAFYDPAWLILLGNGVFLTGVSLVVSYVASQNFLATGRTQILLLGCGVLIFGLGGALAAVVRSLPNGANLNVAMYNTAALLGAAFHLIAALFLLTGVSPEVGARRRGFWLVWGYAGSTLVMLLFAAACFRGLIPPFFVQGIGPTALRQRVLGSADAFFLFSFVIFAGTYLRTKETFLYWYACALALTGISLAAFFLQHSVGSPLGWAGRFSQYVGGVYFLISLAVAARTAESRGTSLGYVLTASLSGAEEKFRALAENAPDAIRRFDRDLKHIYVNPAGQRLYGKPAEAIVGRRMEEAGLAEGKLWSERIQRVFQVGEPIQVEEYLPTEDGMAFYQSRCVPEHGPDGEVANVLVLSRDLTEGKRAQEALAQSEAKYHSLFENMTEEVHFWRLIRDEEGLIKTWRLVDANPPALATWGKVLEEISGLTTDEIFGLGATEHYMPIVQKITSEGVPLSFEDYFPHLDKYFHFTSIPLGDHFITTGADITGLRKAVQRAEEERAQLEAVFQAVQDGIIVSDMSGTFVLVNEAEIHCAAGTRALRDLSSFAEIYELSLPSGEVLPLEQWPISRVLRGHSIVDTEVRSRRKDTGQEWLFSSTGQPVRDAQGKQYLAVVVTRNVTDRRRAEEALREANLQLEEADRRKNEFLAMLSHELRNPLAPMRNSLYLLDRATPGSPQFTRAREVLGRQIEHLTRLIDDLLDITRISRGKLELRRVVVDARDIVQKTCADHVTLFEQRGIDFHMEIPGGSLWIDADSTRISQALRNLLVNAAKFTPEGGQVLVGVSRAGNQVEVSVKDNGLGMELETLANLFQPFVQAERARERARGGLGLGLALAKGLVETHGGNLRGESAGTHRGSRFTMSLPLAPAPERKQELPAVSAPLHVLDVLVIEDNVDGAETLAAVLELHGHRAHIATDGLLGLTKARELKPDVILCDLDLPGLDGYEIARRLRAEGEMLATRLIALSGYAGATDKQLALEAGFTAHLAKPVSLDELSALLANKA